jgi:hypothetical protein
MSDSSFAEIRPLLCNLGLPPCSSRWPPKATHDWIRKVGNVDPPEDPVVRRNTKPRIANLHASPKRKAPRLVWLVSDLQATQNTMKLSLHKFWRYVHQLDPLDIDLIHPLSSPRAFQVACSSSCLAKKTCQLRLESRSRPDATLPVDLQGLQG